MVETRWVFISITTMQLFELTKIMFEDPIAYEEVGRGEKRKNFFNSPSFFSSKCQSVYFTSIDFTIRGRAFGSLTVNTPFFTLASISSSLTLGMRKDVCQCRAG